jgi:exodeoxyribonuclease VIII
MKHIMLDLETMDNRATATIVTIGAIEFDPCTGETGQEFYKIVDMQTCINAGSTLSSGTIEWWLTQSAPARKELTLKNKVSIEDACDSFIRFCHSISSMDLNQTRYTYPDVCIWGNGATFDNAIFRQTYSTTNKPFPADFWNDRDVRTVLSFYPSQLFKDWKTANQRDGYHNALSDSKYQVRYLSHIMKELGVTELY